MRPILLLSACCLLSLAAPAAIITERNDVYDGAGCYTPPAYTFIGTPSRPGIDSCWIPYGTYTDGVGGTEYTRVTSNLMGVVASILGGVAERAYVTGGYYSPTVGDGFGNWPTLLRPITTPPQSWDFGEYLESATNTSLRIADQLNWGILYMRQWAESGTYHYPVYPESIEPLLAKTDNYYGYYTFNGGIAGSFGSRVLDDLTGNAEPPISSEWTTAIPFDVDDADVWLNVWPTYAACTNDIHFFPGTNSYLHILPKEWGTSGTGPELWGDDVSDARYALHTLLTNMPLSVTLEDVLSADTVWKYEVPPVETGSWWTVSGPLGNFRAGRYEDLGDRVEWDNWESPYPTNYYVVVQYSRSLDQWMFSISLAHEPYSLLFQQTASGDEDSDDLYFGSYHGQRTRLIAHKDDYTHWRNMTTRLDWKRLGIICQLERQMETTYKVYEGTMDYLPFLKFTAEHGITFDDYLDLELPPIEESISTNIPLRTLSPTWSQSGESYEISTNSLGWRRPTCRLPEPAAYGSVSFLGGNLTKSLELSQPDAEDLMTLLAQNIGLTNGEYDIVMSGNWAESSATSVDYFATLAENWGWVTHPSNTVTTLVDGKTTSVTGPEPIASRNWYYSEGQYPSPDFMDWELRLSDRDFIYNQGDSNWQGAYLYCHLPQDIDTTNGTYTAPSVVFTAIGEDDDFTNWTWQTTGILGTNCVKTITGDSVQWRWTSDESESVFSEITFHRDFWDCYTQNQPGGLGSFEQYGTNVYPRVISSPAISVTWQTGSYRRWDKLWTETNPVNYTISFDYDLTNTSVHAILGLNKSAYGTWTYSEVDAWDEIKRRFGNEDWNRIYSVRHPALELLLSDSGPGSMTASFEWENIKYHSGAERLFRMSPFSASEARSKSESDTIRLQMLRALDIACKDKCVALGGMDPRDLANFGRLSEREINQIKSKVLDEDVMATYGVNPLTNDFSIAGHITVSAQEPHEITVSDITAGYDILYPLPARVGSCGWTLHIDQVSATNIYKSVRADAHQAKVDKTLWRFKNLRDPNL